jgi:AcrR family transcriptional regulator
MPKIIDKEAKKLEILHAAMHVFARKGIIKTKMIDIAQAAGVGKGTLYEYFPSKEGIFNNAYSYLIEITSQALTTALESTDDPVRKLELLMETSFSCFLHDGGEFAEIMMDFWAEGVRTKDDTVLSIIDLKSVYAEYRRIISEILSNGIARGVFKKMDVHAMSSGLIAAFDGLLLQWIMDREAIDITKVSRNMLHGFLSGIKASR